MATFAGIDHFDALNRRDFDAGMSFFAPDAVWESPPRGTSFDGLAAIRGFGEDYSAAFEELAVELEEVADLGNGVVFAVIQVDARPSRSTGRIRTHMAPIFEWVDDLIVWAANYTDIDEARAAAGRLAEERG
jgi:ketosteroid isomerase-like protein